MFISNLAPVFELGNNNIHLWTIDPQAITATTRLSALKNILSQREIEKIASYRSAKAQHNALITRAFVRLLLSQYAPIKPQDWVFTIGKHGKPELQNAPFALRFNLSHNDKLIVCAVCLQHDIGCDVESLSRKISTDAISKRYFSASEYQSLNKMPAARQNAKFFEYWTLKEAFVKATGLGISQGLDSFSFTINQGDSTKFNDNISLSFAANSLLQNNHHWYACLTYPDQMHCIAICIKGGKDKTDFKLESFSAVAELAAFN